MDPDPLHGRRSSPHGAPDPRPDRWLDRWAAAIRAAAAGGPVLEIGCGSGDDTSTLLGMGLQVVAFDVSAEQVARARAAAPGAACSVCSVLDPFPLEGSGVGVVVASLTLHYFPWAQTVSLVERIRATLRVGGLLLARVNSTEDLHYGARGHPPIEPGLYRVDGSPKRFFAEADLDRLFARGWQLRGREHLVTHKYGWPKRLWEVAAERAA